MYAVNRLQQKLEEKQEKLEQDIEVFSLQPNANTMDSPVAPIRK